MVGPSGLEGWSRLTIACHLRYGAGAFLRMTEGALAGTPVAYYPEGRDAQRPGTLVPAAGESPRSVVDDLAATSDALHGRWAALGAEAWRRQVEEPEGNVDLGTVELARLPLMRLTEVEVHGTDLDLGLSDWSRTFVDSALAFRLHWLPTRRSNHRAVDPSVEGSWLLVATDGAAHLLTVEAGVVSVTDADRTNPSGAVIEGSSRDLLALLLGRPSVRALQLSGDVALAGAFGRAFPGP
jgi:hypothetical protein